MTEEEYITIKRRTQPKAPEASTLEKLQYGFDTSSWMLGDIGRVAESYLTGQSIKELDDQRVAKLNKKYKNLSAKDKTSTAASVGETFGEIIDPVFWIPYLGQVGALRKGATLGQKALAKTKSGTALGSLVAADSAVDSIARGEEINAGGVGVAFATGFVPGAIFSPSAKVTNIRPSSINISEQQKPLTKWLNPTLSEADEKTVQTVLQQTEKENVKFVAALRDVPDIGRQAGEATKTIDALVKAKRKAKKIAKRKGEKLKINDPALLKYVPSELVEAEVKAQQFLKTLPSLYKKYSEDLADGSFNTLENLSKNNTFNSNVFARAITRPLMGGIAGYGLGVTNNFFSEEDHLSPWGWALAGLTMGQLSKKIIKSNLSLNVKEEGLKGVEDLARRSLWAQTNMFFAGSHAAKLNVYGDDVAAFGKNMFRQMGYGVEGATTQSLEETISRVTQQLNKQLNDASIQFNLSGVKNREAREAAFDLANGFTNEAKLASRFSAEEITNIKGYSDFSRTFTDAFATEVKNVGIDFKELKDYGLPQLHNVEKIISNKNEALIAYTKAFEAQSPESVDHAKMAEKFINNLITMGGSRKIIRSAFKKQGDYDDPNKVLRPMTDHFEKKRKIVSFEARNEIKDFLIRDTDQVLKTFLDKSVDKVEFARRYGPNGEGIQQLRNKIVDDTSQAKQIAATEKQRTILNNRQNAQIKAINESVDLLFGLHNADTALAKSTVANNTFSVLTTMANLTYLPKATVAAIGDVIQPFQNSGVYNTMKGYGKAMDSERDFSKLSGFAAKDVLGQELRQFYTGSTPSGVPGSLLQLTTRKVNEKFFRTIGLASLTQHAGRFAYNAGIEDGFKVAKQMAKGQQSTSLKAQARQLGITDEMADTLNKFKTVDEAFADDLGQEFLDRIGNKASSRDRIIPEIGNRRAFTQSKDPFIRSLGQFLSWAQAKTTQTNALVSRIEDGDVALATRMLGTLILYDGVLTFRDFLNDPLGERLEEQGYSDFADKITSFDQIIGRGSIFSGNFAPWQVDKVARVLSGARYGDSLESISPTAAWAASLVEGIPAVSKNIQARDYEGATYQAVRRLPLGREALAIQGITTNRPLKDQPNRKPMGAQTGSLFLNKGGRVNSVLTKKRIQKLEGGAVPLPIPNAPLNPSERLDKFTGLSYDEQAEGERHTFVAGGLSKLLKVLTKKVADVPEESVPIRPVPPKQLDVENTPKFDPNITARLEAQGVDIAKSLQEGGQYVDPRTAEVLTNRVITDSVIDGVTSNNNKPIMKGRLRSFSTDEKFTKQIEEAAQQKKNNKDITTLKTNLINPRNYTLINSKVEGLKNHLQGKRFIVTVEGKGGKQYKKDRGVETNHAYGLTVKAKGDGFLQRVLKPEPKNRYKTAEGEGYAQPSLRPHYIGDYKTGKRIGTIITSGKRKHPLYDTIYIDAEDLRDYVGKAEGGLTDAGQVVNIELS